MAPIGKKDGTPLPRHVRDAAAAARDGDGVTRREFLAMASIFGALDGRRLRAARPRRPGARRRPGGGHARRHAARLDARPRPEGPAHLRLERDGQHRAAGPRAAGQVHRRLHLRADAARELGGERRRDRVHAERAPGRHVAQRRPLHRRRRDLQPRALVRARRRGQLDGGALLDPDRRGERHPRRGHRRARRRSHRQARAAATGHHADRGDERLPGAGRPPLLRRDAEHDRELDRHRTVRARRVERRLQRLGRAPRGREMVGRRGAARRRRLHRLRHRPRGRDRRVRVRGGPRQPRERVRVHRRSSTRSAWSSPSPSRRRRSACA